MSKRLDDLIVVIIMVLAGMALLHLVADHVFEPLSLAAAVSSLLSVRVAHHHAPRFIDAKWGRRGAGTSGKEGAP